MTSLPMAPTQFSGQRPGDRLAEREWAALRRVAALMRAEAAELAPSSWVRRRLETDVAVGGWGELVLPELALLMRGEEASSPGSWVRGREEAGPLELDEEAALRRLGALMRAESAELDDPASPVRRRLDGWGIRLALACELPDRARPL
jgi:hypothetical protein